MFICKFCKSERISSNSLKQHEIRCSNNPDKLNLKREFRSGVKAGWTLERKEKWKKRLKEDNINGKGWFSEKCKRESKEREQIPWSKERRESHSLKMQKVVLENPESYNRNSGRAKVFYVKNLNQEILKVRGSWEKIFVEWCNINNILCLVKNTSFEYFYENKKHNYFPDFYLPVTNEWIEIKGYETEKDRAKWLAFPNTLKIFKQKEIKKMQQEIALKEMA